MSRGNSRFEKEKRDISKSIDKLEEKYKKQPNDESSGVNGDSYDNHDNQDPELDPELDPESEDKDDEDSESEDESEDDKDSESEDESEDDKDSESEDESEDDKNSGDEDESEDDKNSGDEDKTNKKEDNEKFRNSDKESKEKSKVEIPDSDGEIPSPGNPAGLASKLTDKLGNTRAGKSLKAISKNLKRVAKLAEKLTQTSGLAIKMLASPITWVIIGLLLLFVVITSTRQVVGKNDYNLACDASGSGVINIDGDADAFTRQSAIAAWLTSTPFEAFGGKPLTREQAIGVVGNLIHESYGANNKAFEGDHEIKMWETCDNTCVLEFGAKRNQGIGIVQWDSGRRLKLVNFAIEENKQWHDLNTQLKFLKKELDTGEGANLANSDFANPANSIEEYTKLWDEKFERSDGKSTDKRIAYAVDFGSKYAGGQGLAMNCIGGMGVDTSNLVQLAIASSYGSQERDRSRIADKCNGVNENCGLSISKPEYVSAKQIAEEKTGKDPITGLMASCDRFVASMYRATRKDTTYPWGGVKIQKSYMESSPDWQEVGCQSRLPGDVLVALSEGHIMLYVGIVNGIDSSASASNQDRTAAILGMSCDGDIFNADDMPAKGWRKMR